MAMTEQAIEAQPGTKTIDRAGDLEEIASRLGERITARTPRSLVAAGDSLELLRRLPDSSVSLIVVDPPYHSTKKANIMGDTDFSADEDYLAWIEAYAREWHRILRMNGSLFMFCASDMSAHLEVRIGGFLRPLSHITWTKPNDPGFDGWKGKMKKEALRRWYPHSERILFFGQATDDHVRRSPLGAFLREARKKAGLSGHELTEVVGAYGRVNHGGAVSNWETGRNVPSREQYERIVDALESTGKVQGLPAFEDAVRPFQVSPDVPFTDVWNFPSVRVYPGKHPAEKPVELLSHIVEATSYEGDLVLDCFAGSGSTLEAALVANRRTIGMELDERWVQRSIQRVEVAEGKSEVTALGDFRSRRRAQAVRSGVPTLF